MWNCSSPAFSPALAILAKFFFVARALAIFLPVKNGRKSWFERMRLVPTDDHRSVCSRLRFSPDLCVILAGETNKW